MQQSGGMTDHAPSPDRLLRLAEALEQLDLGPGGEGAELRRRRAVTAAGEYLAPRLADESDKLVVAVVGPGGSGKSTIVNSIARCRISETGPLRPTTTQPVAWTDGTMPLTLEGLRSRLPGSVVDSLRPPPEGVVIVDTPPPEVADESGVPIVRQVLEVADAVIFVAGATRYADADSFDLLEAAAARGLPTVVVLNRLPETPEIQQVIAADFAVKLANRRLLPRAAAELVVTVSEGDVLPGTGGLMPETVARVVKDLEAMADPQARPDIRRAAVAGTLQRLRDDLAALRAEVMDGAVRRVELIDPMRAVYRQEGRRLVAEIKSGKFATVPERRLIDALTSAAARRAGLAARAVAEVWHRVAPDLVEGAPELFGHGPDTLLAARERLGFWLAELKGLPARAAGGRRVGRRTRRKLAAAALRGSLDPRFRPDAATARRLSRTPGLIDAARERLAEELHGILHTDSLRFVDRLGPGLPEGILSELAEGAL